MAMSNEDWREMERERTSKKKKEGMSGRRRERVGLRAGEARMNEQKKGAMQRNENEPEKQTNKQQAHALTEENKRVVRRKRRRRYAWRTARRLRAASARLPAAPRNWAPRWDQVRGLPPPVRSGALGRR